MEYNNNTPELSKPCDLTSLLQSSSEAERMFSSLPEYVQNTIKSRGDSIHSIRDIEAYAQNLLAGDH